MNCFWDLFQQKSIDKITADHLYTCYNTFYHPSNMLLFVVGAVDPTEMMAVIESNQSKKQFDKLKEIKIKEFKEDNKVVKEKEEISVPTNVPKVAYTLKIPIKNIKFSRRKLHLLINFQTQKNLGQILSFVL